MNKLQPPSPHRVLWLDSLRGIAALMVAVMHLWEYLIYIYIQETSQPVSEIINLIILDCLNFGKLGIIIFFMISGYVIPFSLGNKNIKKFLIARFFRLYPAYWFSILMFVIVGGVIPSAFILGANITMFHKFAGIPDLVGVYWTLQIELSFYILCVLLFYKKLLFNMSAISKIIYALICLAVIMSFVRYITEIKLPVALLLGLILMFLGMQWRFCSGTRDYETLRINIIFFIGALIPICFLAYNRNYGYDETWYKYFISYILGIVIFYLFSKFRIKIKLSGFLGNIRYSSYLLHPVSLVLLATITSKYTMTFVQYIVFFFVSMFVFSIISYYLIEKPAIKFGKRFQN
jgi:peptidoglycan/LPS O-acetylase OafA/YrhL